MHGAELTLSAAFSGCLKLLREDFYPMKITFTLITPAAVLHKQETEIQKTRLTASLHKSRRRVKLSGYLNKFMKAS